MNSNRITIVGAGNVGATTAHIAASRKLGDIVLIDIVKGLAEGKALDMAQAGPVQGYSVQITGTTDWSKTEGSNIVVITSGLARKPGMSRDDLLIKNVQIVKEVSERIAKYCPDSIVIVVSNPLDAMVYTAAKVTGFAKSRIMGMAGVLDAARFSYFIAGQLGVKAEDVQSILMGGHGDDMVPLPRFTTVSGTPITELLDVETISRLVERTRKGGIEVVDLLGSSAYYAPAAGVVKMAEAIISDTKAIMPCCAYCEKEYGAGGYFVGVPVVLGKNGVEKVVELKLNPDERAEFDRSLGHVKELSAKVDKLL
ncbi:MAG: malate dehydrogenase [Sedimentisphaerales bacterium]|nr:malate dehydrogenase [Sedimentisphaerales bacterium]